MNRDVIDSVTCKAVANMHNLCVICDFFQQWKVEGDRGAGDQEKRGQEVYGRREKKGREAGFPRWRQAEEKWKITQHCAIFRNRKNAKRREPTNTGREPGLKGTEAGGFNHAPPAFHAFHPSPPNWKPLLQEQ